MRCEACEPRTKIGFTYSAMKIIPYLKSVLSDTVTESVI